VKGLVTGFAVLMLAPIMMLGLLVGMFAATSSLDAGCPPATTQTTISTGPVESTDACGGVGDQGPATAFRGPDGYVDDPTSSGRITRQMLHTYNEVNRVFNSWPWGTVCWSAHLWNPTSDHPLGLECSHFSRHWIKLPTG
jgi:hypothetical protein